MSDTTPSDEDGGPEATSHDETEEGAADLLSGAGALADRAREMLGRHEEPTSRIVEAATGDKSTPDTVGAEDDRPSDTVSASEKGSEPGSPSSRPLLDAATGAVSGVSGAIRDAAAVGGGSGAGGSSGGGAGGDDDEEGLFAGLPISAAGQIILLGLLVTAVLLFGASIWSALFGDDDNPVADEVISAAAPLTADDEPTEVTAVSSTDADADADDSASTATSATDAGGATTTAPSTTDAPTTAAPTTTEAATTSDPPATTAVASSATTAAPADAFTMWDALNESGLADQFATLGGALGLQGSLEDPGVDRTLFAPSDAALDALDATILTDAASDPEGAGAALVGYHFVDERLLAADLVALDGQQLTSLTGLPIGITIVDGDVVMNGTTRIVASDFESDNGVVHIIDLVLAPPTVNDVLGLDNIEFEVNSAVITPEGQAELAKAVEFFRANLELTASIEGHTDTDGSEERNLTLSQERADAVKEFLVENGLDGDRFTTTGFGETRPILIDDVEDKSASRRIEFVIR